MSQMLTFYVELDTDDEAQAQELAAAVRNLEAVAAVDAHVEEPERGALEIIQSITLTVTALGGAVTATCALVNQVQQLLARFGVKSAHVETAEGLRELSLGGEPRNENPAQ